MIRQVSREDGAGRGELLHNISYKGTTKYLMCEIEELEIHILVLRRVLAVHQY